MTQFAFVYRLPEHYVPGNEQSVIAWTAWFAGIGRDLLDLGKPVIRVESVGETTDGVRLAGFSVVQATDLDAAIAIARGCPAIGDGGGVEIGTLTEPSQSTVASAAAGSD